MSIISKIESIINDIRKNLEEEENDEEVLRNEIEDFSDSVNNIIKDEGKSWEPINSEKVDDVHQDFIHLTADLIEATEEIEAIFEEEKDAKKYLDNIIDSVENGEITLSEDQEKRLKSLKDVDTEDQKYLLNELETIWTELNETEKLANKFAQALTVHMKNSTDQKEKEKLKENIVDVGNRKSALKDSKEVIKAQINQLG